MKITNTQNKERMTGLHELVLSTLEEMLHEDPSPKAVELAMKFLKDNSVFLDLSATDSREAIKAKMASIPRLSPDELKLG